MVELDSILTAAAVFIAGICTYEYSMWRTKRYIKKLVQEQTPKIIQLIQPLTQTLLPSGSPAGLKRKPEDYE